MIFTFFVYCQLTGIADSSAKSDLEISSEFFGDLKK
jgi:hypothetical protein